MLEITSISPKEIIDNNIKVLEFKIFGIEKKKIAKIMETKSCFSEEINKTD